MKRFAGPAVVAVACLTAAQSKVDTAGERSCTALLKSLGMPPIQRPVARTKRGELTTIRWNEQFCSYDAQGKARAAADIRELQPSAGAPKIKGPAEVLQLVKSKVASAGFRLENADVTPAGAWGSEPRVVMVSTLARVHGQPTHGFAGGARLQVNRISGKIASFAWSPEFTVDKPNVKISKDKALQLAEPVLRTKKEAGRTYVSNAILQYFRPSPTRATDEGKRQLKERRLRYCWVVTLAMGRTLSDMSAPVAAVAFDAETGKQINRP